MGLEAIYSTTGTGSNQTKLFFNFFNRFNSCFYYLIFLVLFFWKLGSIKFLIFSQVCTKCLDQIN